MRMESLVAPIERAGWLDALGAMLGRAVASVVRPGPALELLAGTWLGHPVHPVLTDLSDLADTEERPERGLGRAHALADRCNRRGGPLHEGRVDGGSVRCP